MEPTQLAIISLAVLGLFIVMQVTRRNWKRSQRRTEPSAREQYESHRQSSLATRDLEQVMMELDQLSRQIHGKLDTRFAKLETVIRDADERIDKLSRLVRGSQGAPTLDVTIGDDEPLEMPTQEPPTILSNAPTSPIDTKRESIYRLADDGVDPIKIAEQIGTTAGEVELILSLRRAKECVKNSQRTPQPARQKT